MKVLLTGGSGNLGQALVPRLLGGGDTEAGFPAPVALGRDVGRCAVILANP